MRAGYGRCTFGVRCVVARRVSSVVVGWVHSMVACRVSSRTAGGVLCMVAGRVSNLVACWVH